MKCGGYVQQYHEFENFQIDFSKKKIKMQVLEESNMKKI